MAPSCTNNLRPAITGIGLSLMGDFIPTLDLLPKAAYTRAKKLIEDGVLPKDQHIKKIDGQRALAATGFEGRWWLSPEQSLLEPMIAASHEALANANRQASELTYIIVATMTPEYLTPSASVRLRDALSAPPNCRVNDINVACASWLAALENACAYLKSNPKERVLIVAGDAFSRIVNFADPNVALIFADGYTATIVETVNIEDLNPETDEGEPFFVWGSAPAPGALLCPGPAAPPSIRRVLTMPDGAAVAFGAILTMVGLTRQIIQERKLTFDHNAPLGRHIAHFGPHPGNINGLTRPVVESVNAPPEISDFSAVNLGNIGPGTIPHGLYQAIKAGRFGGRGGIALLTAAAPSITSVAGCIFVRPA